MLRRFVLLLVAVSAVLLAGESRAYVRTQAKAGRVTLRWAAPSIALTFDTRDLPAGLSRQAALGALQRAAASWSAPTCTSLRIAVKDGSPTQPGGHEDRRNSLAFHARHFCEAGVNRTGKCHDARATSVTRVRTGSPLPDGALEITEVDIELNAVAFGWSASAARPPVTADADLETVVLHELGHALGLDHVCVRGATGAQRRDHAGRPRPQCEAAAPELRASVMVPAGDQASGAPLPFRRALAADDVAAVCALYPAASTAGACDCRLGPRRAARGLAPSLLILGLLVCIRRRRRRRPARGPG